MNDRGVILAILGVSAIFYFSVWAWLYLINRNLINLRKDIFNKVDEEADELNKDAGAIKRRQTWSKKRELKDLENRTSKLARGEEVPDERATKASRAKAKG